MGNCNSSSQYLNVRLPSPRRQPLGRLLTNKQSSSYLHSFCSDSTTVCDDDKMPSPLTHNGIYIFSLFASPCDTLQLSPQGDASLPVGVTGLINMGNTCFLNSALQCLNAASPLSLYFLTSNWKKEVNKTNPLGHSGALAKAYAKTVKNLWTEHKLTIPLVQPKLLHRKMASAFPQFKGHLQHDAQEFLSALLDGLHEDLNRVEKKPYVGT